MPVETAATPPVTTQPLTSQGAVRAGVTDGGQRVAQPRQRVPGPQDQQATGTYAVPRGTVASAPRPSDSDRYRIRSTTRVYNNYYYYPRHSYPYGFGSYGLGYFYYDPYTWYDYNPYSIYSYPYASYPTYAANVYQYRYGYPTGEIRLQVRPRHAEVYVDGYYAGLVDEFDGVFQSLRLEEGPHMIEIVAPGYTTLIFNVRIVAGRKLDYRADLLPY